MHKQFISRFVRDTLGCTCPDEVFSQIEVRTDVVFKDAPTDLRTIVIGQRLLIHLWETNDPTRVQNNLPELMSVGRDHRDEQGLKRYRLVIVTDNLVSIGAIAQRVFNRLKERDAKIHLHVIDRQDVVDLLG